MPAQEPVIVGRFGAPYGIKGWLRVTSFTDPADNIRDYQPWLVHSERGWDEIELVALRTLPKGFAVQVAGIGDRDEAALLRGREISVLASSLGEAGPDEVYWKDLIGLAARSTDGEPLGEVSSLMPGGSHDVLVIDSASRQQPILVPFHRDYVRDVDVEGGALVADISGFKD